MKWAVFGFWAILSLLLFASAAIVIVALYYWPLARTWESFALVIVLVVMMYLCICFTREAWGEWEHER